MKERNKCRLNGNNDRYMFLRNKMSNLIEKAKQENYQSKIEEGKSDPKSIWTLFKELGANGKGNNSERQTGEQLVTHEADLTQLFNS